MSVTPCCEDERCPAQNINQVTCPYSSSQVVAVALSTIKVVKPWSPESHKITTGTRLSMITNYNPFYVSIRSAPPLEKHHVHCKMYNVHCTSISSKCWTRRSSNGDSSSGNIFPPCPLQMYQVWGTRHQVCSRVAGCVFFSFKGHAKVLKSKRMIGKNMDVIKSYQLFWRWHLETWGANSARVMLNILCRNSSWEIQLSEGEGCSGGVGYCGASRTRPPSSDWPLLQLLYLLHLHLLHLHQLHLQILINFLAISPAH